jgi:hypothetical protein
MEYEKGLFTCSKKNKWIPVASLDYCSAKVHLDAKNWKQAVGTFTGSLNKKMYMMVADEQAAHGFILYGGEVGNAYEGRFLWDNREDEQPQGERTDILGTGLGLEDGASLRLASEGAYPGGSSSKEPEAYDTELYSNSEYKKNILSA